MAEKTKPSITNTIKVHNKTTGTDRVVKQTLTMSSENPHLLAFSGWAKENSPDSKKFSLQPIFHIEEEKGQYFIVFDNPSLIVNKDADGNQHDLGEKVLGGVKRFPLVGNSSINIAKVASGEICFQVEIEGKKQILKLVANATTIKVEQFDEEGKLLGSYAFRQPIKENNEGIQIDMQPELFDKFLDKDQPVFKTWATVGFGKKTPVLENAPHSIRVLPKELIELRAMNLPEKSGQFKAGDYTVTYYKPEKGEPVFLVTQPPIVRYKHDEKGNLIVDEKTGKPVVSSKEKAKTYLLTGGSLVECKYSMLQFNKDTKEGYIVIADSSKKVVNYEIDIGKVDKLDGSDALKFIEYLDSPPLKDTVAQRTESSRVINKDVFNGFVFAGYDSSMAAGIQQNNKGRTINLEEDDLEKEKTDTDGPGPDGPGPDGPDGPGPDGPGPEGPGPEHPPITIGDPGPDGPEHPPITTGDPGPDGPEHPPITTGDPGPDGPGGGGGPVDPGPDGPGGGDGPVDPGPDGPVDPGPDGPGGGGDGPSGGDDEDEEENDTTDVDGVSSDDTQEEEKKQEEKENLTFTPKEKWKKGEKVNLSKHVEWFGETLTSVGVFMALVSILVPFGPLLLIFAGIFFGVGATAMGLADKFQYTPYIQALDKVEELKEQEDEDENFSQQFMAKENELDKLESKAFEKEQTLEDLLTSENSTEQAMELGRLYNDYGVGFNPTNNPQKTSQLVTPDGHDVRHQMLVQLQAINSANKSEEKNKLIDQFFKDNFYSLPPSRREAAEQTLFGGPNETPEQSAARQRNMDSLISALQAADYAENEYLDAKHAQEEVLGSANDSNVERLIRDNYAGQSNDERLDTFTRRYSHTLVRRFSNDKNINEQKLDRILSYLTPEQQTKLIDALNNAHTDIETSREKIEQLATQNREKVAIAKDLGNYGKVLNELETQDTVSSLQEVSAAVKDLLIVSTRQSYEITGEKFRTAQTEKLKNIKKDLVGDKISAPVYASIARSAEWLIAKPDIKGARREITSTHKILAENILNNYGERLAEEYVYDTPNNALPSTNPGAVPDTTIISVAESIVEEELCKLEGYTPDKRDAFIAKLPPKIQTLNNQLQDVKDAEEKFKQEQAAKVKKEVTILQKPLEKMAKDLKIDISDEALPGDTQLGLTDYEVQNADPAVIKQMKILAKISKENLPKPVKELFKLQYDLLKSYVNGTITQKDINAALAAGLSVPGIKQPDLDVPIEEYQKALRGKVNGYRNGLQIIDSFISIDEKTKKSLRKEFKRTGDLEGVLKDHFGDKAIEENDKSFDDILQDCAPSKERVTSILSITINSDQTQKIVDALFSSQEPPKNAKEWKKFVEDCFRASLPENASQEARDKFVKKHSAAIAKITKYMAQPVDLKQLEGVVNGRIDLQNAHADLEVHCNDNIVGKKYATKYYKHCKKEHNKDNTPTYDNELQLIEHLAQEKDRKEGRKKDQPSYEQQIIEEIQKNPNISNKKLAKKVLGITGKEWAKEVKKVKITGKGESEEAQRAVWLQDKKCVEILTHQADFQRVWLNALADPSKIPELRDYVEDALKKLKNTKQDTSQKGLKGLKERIESLKSSRDRAQFLKDIGLDVKQLSEILAGDDPAQIIGKLNAINDNCAPLEKAERLYENADLEKEELEVTARGLTKEDREAVDTAKEYDHFSMDKCDFETKIQFIESLAKQYNLNQQEIQGIYKAFSEGNAQNVTIKINGKDVKLNDLLASSAQGVSFSDEDLNLLKRLGVDPKNIGDQKKRNKKLDKILNGLLSQQKELETKAKEAYQKTIDDKNKNADLDKKSETNVREGLGLFGRILARIKEKDQKAVEARQAAQHEAEQQAAEQQAAQQQAAPSTENEQPAPEGGLAQEQPADSAAKPNPENENNNEDSNEAEAE